MVGSRLTWLYLVVMAVEEVCYQIDESCFERETEVWG